MLPPIRYFRRMGVLSEPCTQLLLNLLGHRFFCYTHSLAELGSLFVFLSRLLDDYWKLDQSAALFRRNPFDLLLKLHGDVELDHLCHNHPPTDVKEECNWLSIRN